MVKPPSFFPFHIPYLKTYSGLRPATLLKNRVRHRWFPVKFVEILKNSFSPRTPSVAASDARESNQSSLKQQTRRADKKNLRNVHPFMNNLNLPANVD